MDFLTSSTHGTSSHGRIAVADEGWTTPQRGLRAKGVLPLTHRLLTEAAIRGSNRLAVGCDLTAAHLWSLAVPSGFGLEVDSQASAVATSRGGTRHRAGGLRGRRLELPAAHLTHVNGVPVTTPARTWLDCAALVSMTDTVAMGDGILRAGLASVHELQSIIDWGRGRRGVRQARVALTILDPAAESPGESWVRAMLVLRGVPRPTCNAEVIASGYRFRLDMAWLDERIAVEYDGVDYHGPADAERDEWRRRLLRNAGWVVIVVRKEDLGDIERVADQVRFALARPVTTRTSCDHSDVL